MAVFSKSGNKVVIELGESEADDLYHILFEVPTEDFDQDQLDLYREIRDKLEGIVNY